MPRYGSFNANLPQPYRTWEADYIKRDKDVVEFWNYPTDGSMSGQLIGVANLEKGWTISQVDAVNKQNQ